MLSGFYKQPEMGLGQKLLHINWGLVLILSMIGAIGGAMLYSAGGGRFGHRGNWCVLGLALF